MGVIFFFVDLGEFETFIFEGALLALDNFDKGNIFRELSDLWGIEIGHSAIFWTNYLMIFFFIFDDEGVKAVLAVGVPASSQQAR